MAGTKTSIYLTDEIRRKLKVSPYGERGASKAVSMIVTRYDNIMRQATREVKDMFTHEELTECVNACISTSLSDCLPDTVLTNIEDTLASESLYPESKHELEKKLRTLNILQQYALLEVVENLRIETSFATF